MHDLLKRILRGLPARSRADVLRASKFSSKHLEGLTRRSGEEYVLHCHEVALTLREVTDDPSTLIVALTHDLLLHPDGDALVKEAPLTAEQRSLVREMHALRRLHIDEQTKDLDRALKAFASDYRLLPLRMAHRLHDIRHIARFTADDRKQIARETLHMYSAIAGRLGMHAWRHEMEDTCFRLLQPEAAKSLERQFELHAKNDQRCLKHVRSLLLRESKRHGISAKISTRMKSLYSSYRKMVVKGRRLDELTDRLAVRILVPSLDDCYRTLGVVHACLHPIPGKLKDYIGAPKENGYRSIHTVVYPLPGVTDYPVEIQIRTAAMDQECEFGSARHVDYKHSLYAFHSKMARVDMFKNLLVLRESARSPEQFEHSLRTYFDDKRIAIFDQKSTLYHVSSPLTVLDFVCHTAGKRVRFLKSVRINGQDAPFDASLRDGDTVECKFGREMTFKKEWLRGCRQTSSKRLIRSLISPNP